MTVSETRRRLRAVGMVYVGERWGAAIIKPGDERRPGQLFLAHEASTRLPWRVGSLSVVAYGHTGEEARAALVAYCEAAARGAKTAG